MQRRLADAPADTAASPAPDAAGFEQAVSDWLDTQLDWDTGNLVLFTSRAKLDRVLQKLPIAQVRKVRAQGSLGKSQLVAEHCADIEAGKIPAQRTPDKGAKTRPTRPAGV